jgi:hypothetical protein
MPIPGMAALSGAGQMIAGTGLSLGSGLINLYSARQAQDANREAMMNRHQWEVRDLVRAGLNPILSARNSGTPGLPGVATTVPNMAADFIGAMGTAAEVRKKDTEIKKLEEEIRSIPVMRNKTEAEVKKVKAEIWSLGEQANLYYQQVVGKSLQNETDEIKVKFLKENPWLIKAAETSKAIGLSGRDVMHALGAAIGIRSLGKIRPDQLLIDKNTGEVLKGNPR